MKSLSTDNATEQYYIKLKSSNCYTHTKVTYIDDDGLEVLFHDHQYPIVIDKKSEPPRYANINFDPAASECEFGVINLGGEYSPKNTLSAKAGILVKDRIFKFYAGTKLKTQADLQTLALSDTVDTTLWFMKVSGATIIPDIANTGANSGEYLLDLFTLYGQGNYDENNYSPSGYALYEKDFSDYIARSGRYNVEKINIVANSTNGRVYYRFGESLSYLQGTTKTSDAWTYAGETINGTKSFDVNGINSRAVQICIVNYASTWDASGLTITSVEVQYREDCEWSLLGTYYLDDPKFDEAMGAALSEIKVTGRNAWKKALETEINLQDLSGGMTLDALIKAVADRVGLVYTTVSIASLSAYGNRTLADGYGDQVKASKVFQDIMVIIGTTYRMSVDDSNILYVQLRPTNILADIVLHYRRYIRASQKTRSDKQLQRLTIFTDQQVLDVDQTLGTADTYTTSGVQATKSFGFTAISKYWKVTSQSGTMKIASVVFTNTTAIATTSGAGSITIQYYGNKFKSTSPRAVGEAVNADNITNSQGNSFQIEDPLFESDAECKTAAESIINEYGDPDVGITVEQAYLDPFTEINDSALVVSRDFIEKGIYQVTGVRHNLNSEIDKHTVLTLVDTGKNIDDDGDIVYDRDKPPISSDLVQYDKGFIYDMRYGQNGDPSEQDPTLYFHDVGYL